MDTTSTSTTQTETKSKANFTLQEKYDPQYIEHGLYDFWDKDLDLFTADNSPDNTKKTFTIMIPPPNVTGTLHIGHALMLSVEDAIVRYRKMSGHNVLWLPGTDHAGIATQVVVEKHLTKTQPGFDREKMGREQFIQKCWDWTKTSGGTIQNQIRKMGSAVDWSREVFTLDKKLNIAVKEAFVRMYQKGKIFRDNRLVNWCCALQTAISQQEVNHIDIPGKTMLKIPGYNRKITFGVITDFSYILNTGEKITVATTRLETMLGDTAIAVNPKDARYSALLEQKAYAIHPFNQRKIPIISDSHVDPEFGTGAVKITPAHDPNDYAIGKRHDLSFINILDPRGLILKEDFDHGVIGGDLFGGLKRYDARDKIAEELDKLGLLGDTRPNSMALALCSRSDDVIEPVIRPQWWVNTDSVAARAAEAVRSGDLKIIPEKHAKTFLHFMDNIQHWCISRQLWWGHRIPAWSISIIDSNGENVPVGSESSSWAIGRNIDEAREFAKGYVAEHCPEYTGEIILKQDEDVLDTWFSSGLFPFSTLGWPNNESPDFKKFFPNSLLETGYDILFFWVARMVMMSLELTDQLPFHTVYLHTMVRDAQGQKMSKSKGNIVDPLDVIFGCSLAELNEKLENSLVPKGEKNRAKQLLKKNFPKGIPVCGTDALRFSLCNYLAQGVSVNLETPTIQGYRFFCNKILQATRFAIQFAFPSGWVPSAKFTLSEHASLTERWILHELSLVIDIVVKAFEEYDLSSATYSLYHFWWHFFCSTFIESIKPVIKSTESSPLFPSKPFSSSNTLAAETDYTQAMDSMRNTCYYVLETGLILLHPFMPFITEHLWQNLPRRPIQEGASELKSIFQSQYPTLEQAKALKDPTSAKIFSTIESAASNVRNLAGILSLSNHRNLEYYILKSPPETATEQELEQMDTDFKNIIHHTDIIASLTNSGVYNIPDSNTKLAGLPSTSAGVFVNFKVQSSGLIDVSETIELLKKKIIKLEKGVLGIDKKLGNAKFISARPQMVPELETQRLEYQTLIASYEATITQLSEPSEQ